MRRFLKRWSGKRGWLQFALVVGWNTLVAVGIASWTTKLSFLEAMSIVNLFVFSLAGVVFGLLIAFNVGALVGVIEALLRVSFLPSSVYLINRMPSDPQSGDIVPIVIISLLLSFVATLYPSWRASRVQPAEALRYE